MKITLLSYPPDLLIFGLLVFNLQKEKLSLMISKMLSRIVINVPKRFMVCRE